MRAGAIFRPGADDFEQVVKTTGGYVPAYYRAQLSNFVQTDSAVVGARLTSKYVDDKYFQLLSTQAASWEVSIPMLQAAFAEVARTIPEAQRWGLVLEYPLYRLRRRIDAVLLARDLLFVVELKVGADHPETADLRQVEEYALDLRDFHKASHGLRMQPLLCCTNLAGPLQLPPCDPEIRIQTPVVSSAKDISDVIVQRYEALLPCLGSQISLPDWDLSAYEPVPTIIEAATTIFAGHTVQDITKASAQNLNECAREVLRLIHEAKALKRKRVIVVTGVPGAGKTLAGLKVAHGEGVDAESQPGGIVYLSGNTPLVLVIREALALDERARAKGRGEHKTLDRIRHELQTRIQHINDFLKEYVKHDSTRPPEENAIVFDEAQRAWDREQGKRKFDRDASEPDILLEIMGRHRQWAAIVCLVGAGQEINSGEAGMVQWGKTLSAQRDWELCAPQTAIRGASDTAGTAIFPDGPPSGLRIILNDSLRLTVPMRSYRSERVSEWVNAVLSGRIDDAAELMSGLSEYPLTLTRSIDECRHWLRAHARGQRRAGLLASTSAVRLLAEGLGTSLTVQDRHKICHWYLKPSDDYRSSNSLEVTANEYTCQGLELDYAGICWGGDFMRERGSSDWSYQKLANTSWNRVHKPDIRRFIQNKYRVFLTRAREGMVLFVPRGDKADNTRPPEAYDRLADYLCSCGARPL